MVQVPFNGLPTGVTRRALIARAAVGVVSGSVVGSAQAKVSEWLPYSPDQVMRIEPLTVAGSTTNAQRMIRLEPVITDFEASARTRALVQRSTPRPLPRLGSQPPRAYVRTGDKFGIDPWLLYGVALQESQLKFGNRTLPYPWTLCVRGRGMRFGNYRETLAALKRFVGSSVTNVDCGAMQVNWHWHKDKLQTFEQALDPYPNLEIGARILRGHFDQRRDWRKAIALYHTDSDLTQETRTRGARYARQAINRLDRMGVPVASLFKGGAHA